MGYVFIILCGVSALLITYLIVSAKDRKDRKRLIKKLTDKLYENQKE